MKSIFHRVKTMRRKIHTAHNKIRITKYNRTSPYGHHSDTNSSLCTDKIVTHLVSFIVWNSFEITLLPLNWLSLLLFLVLASRLMSRLYSFPLSLETSSPNSNLIFPCAQWMLLQASSLEVFWGALVNKFISTFLNFFVFLLSFQVHENGLISFGSTLTDQSPASFPLTNKVLAAAPYWADVYTKRGGRVWYRKTTDDAIVSRATRDVIRAFPRYTGYLASWVVIVTWSEVTFFGALSKYTQNVSYTRAGLFKAWLR